jgi:hypothetical protein
VIDEVDNPASLPYEASTHLETCASCSEFAGQGERLRRLLQEPARVSAPANFEAMVARRLAERMAHKRPFWVAAGFYLRASAAAAALACMILVIQVVRYQPARPISGQATPQPDASAQQMHAGAPTSIPQVSPRSTGTTIDKALGEVATTRPPSKRYPPAKAKPEAAIADITERPGALLWVRNSGSEREIAVPMVSVGAQPWLALSPPSQGERGIRAAF